MKPLRPAPPRPGRLAARWLPRRTVRLRLTLVYGALFLLSGACLLSITYLLVEHYAPAPVMVSQRVATGQGAALGSGDSGGSAAGGQVCLTAGATDPPPSPGQLGQCVAYLQSQEAAQRSDYLNTLLVGAAIALAAMTVAAGGLGWLMAGRALRPLRTITWAARNMSARNLHQRLALAGPDDELKELGDTIDGLLGRLEAAFDAQRQFVANASHELRTPLARQRTLVEVALAERAPSVRELRATCERVLAAGEQHERLIEALWTLASSQRGLDRWERPDLAAIVGEAVQARRLEAASQHVQIDFRADRGPALMLGDTRLAERLVANLLDNAIRHNLPGGWIGVHVGLIQGRAALRVVNSGPVILPGEVARLFAPFQRHRAGRDAGAGGVGLGLSIVSAIAAAHGADLRADALPDGGLDVRLCFPHLPAWPEPRSPLAGGDNPDKEAEPVVALV
jgi:signal transduction histidine kinase